MGGMSVGPLVGGVLLASFWWGSVFLLGVPVMLVLLLTAPLLLPEYRDDDAGRLDLTSVALSLATVLPVIYGLKETAQHGLAAGPVVAVAAGLGFGTVFVRRQLRLRDPLFEITLFRNRPFSAALAINLGGGVVMAGTFLLLSLHLQLVQGFSPLQAGLALVPMNLAMVVATNLTPHLAKRFPAPHLMAAGLVVAAAGLLLLTRVGSEGTLPTLMVAFTLASVGIAVPSVLSIGLIMGAVPPEKAGSASGISETSGELGIALGVATIGSLAGAVYRTELVTPAEVSGRLADAARESITGAVAAAGAVPADVAAALLASARDAFTAGLNLAGAVGAGLFVVMAAVALVVLREPGHGSVAGDATVERDAAV